MKTLKPLLIAASILLTQASFASDKYEEGEKLYKANCAVCHGSTGGMDMTKRIAPPIAAVRMHYIGTYPDQNSFVNAVSSWVEKQDENKSLMRGAIQKFKIMPPLAVAKEDAQKIAAYIYAGDIEELGGFKEHVEEEHEKQGMDKHNGMKKMGDKGKNGKGSDMKGIMQQLNVTPEQQAAMKPLMMKKRSIMQPLRQQMQQINQAINQLDTASPTYKANIFSLAEKKAGLVHRMVIEKGEMRMKMDAILSPTQHNQLKELKKAKKSSHNKMQKMINMH